MKGWEEIVIYSLVDLGVWAELTRRGGGGGGGYVRGALSPFLKNVV